MKNKIMGFILALVLIVLTSATTVSVMTVKPAKPVKTITYHSKYVDELEKFIAGRSYEGYIVKDITYAIGDRQAIGIVVMEKY